MAKIENKSHEVSTEFEQIFHQVQMEIPLWNSFYGDEQLLCSKNA